MEISLALILDELGYGTQTHVAHGTNPTFKTAELLVPGQTHFAPDTLYICELSEAIAASAGSGRFFLCIRSGGPDSREYEDAALAGITIINADVGLRELFNRVHRVFVKVAQWIMDMERSTAKHRGLQELLDLAEQVFGNFITIQDSTFKLIAYTKNIKPPGAVMALLVQYGFQPPETMELFKRNRRLEEYKTISDVIVSRDRITSEYDVVKKTFHLGGSMFIIVVMECCEKPADNATVELFGILIEYIKAYADIDIAQTGGIAGVKSLALDILDGNTSSKEEARVRSTYCGYPFEGGFRLYVFTFEDEDNIPIAQFISHLTESCAETVSLYRTKNILMIEYARADSAATCMNAEHALAGASFICGISADFESLWDLPLAFDQATIASEVAAKQKAPGADIEHGRFRLFSESYIHYIVNEGRISSPGVFNSSLLVQSITKLREYDEQHHTETTRILRSFLENERNATAVASIMHMHRNTVLYHMDKISDLLGVSLDDPETRLQLILAFKADDLM